MLRQRLIAASLGLPMLFVLIFLNVVFRQKGSPDDFFLLGVTLLIAGASGWEVSHILRQRFPKATVWNGLYAALIIPLLVHSVRQVVMLPKGNLVPMSSFALLIDSLGAVAAVMLLFLSVWSDVEHRQMEGVKENLIVLGAGLYLGATLSFLLLMAQMRFTLPGGNGTLFRAPHEAAVLFLFVVVFALDTGAYFGGKYLGKRPLLPKISPKKTVAGAVIGLLTAVVIALAYKTLSVIFVQTTPGWWNLGAYLNWGQFAVLGLAIGIVGQIGDLIESAYKRWGGVKDSGSIIPGHGGFLDRFDSLFLAAPVVYLLLLVFLR